MGWPDAYLQTFSLLLLVLAGASFKLHVDQDPVTGATVVDRQDVLGSMDYSLMLGRTEGIKDSAEAQCRDVQLAGLLSPCQ